MARASLPQESGVTYLIHFQDRYHHAGHYLGSTDNLARRIAEHQAGRGARLMEVIGEAGIAFTVARLWRGGRAMERQLRSRRTAGSCVPSVTAAHVSPVRMRGCSPAWSACCRARRS